MENAALILFTAFLFFQHAFYNVTKVNNLFHMSYALLVSLLMRGQPYRDLRQDRITLQGLSLIALFVVYIHRYQYLAAARGKLPLR